MTVEEDAKALAENLSALYGLIRNFTAPEEEALHFLGKLVELHPRLVRTNPNLLLVHFARQLKLLEQNAQADIFQVRAVVDAWLSVLLVFFKDGHDVLSTMPASDILEMATFILQVRSSLRAASCGLPPIHMNVVNQQMEKAHFALVSRVVTIIGELSSLASTALLAMPPRTKELLLDHINWVVKMRTLDNNIFASTMNTLGSFPFVLPASSPSFNSYLLPLGNRKAREACACIARSPMG